MKRINLPPYAPMLMESTRALGYSLEAAVADLIDNSITAEATQIKINFWPYDNPYFTILDNGKGMTPAKITEAMRYGSCDPLKERSLNDLGRFGLGLKTASLSQCRCLTVISLSNGIISGRRWDLDFIKDEEEWNLLDLDQEEINKLPQINTLLEQDCGTLIIWNSLDRISIGETNLEQALSYKMDLVREHLSLVFHRYLTGEPGLKKIVIYINENPVEAFDPFFTTKSTTIMDSELISVGGHIVEVKPFILPHPSKISKEELDKYGGRDGLRKLQGFYVYRNKRLLVWGTWFRLIHQDEFSKLARVRVDIPNSLDNLWTLDIRKSTAVPPEIVKVNLKRIIGIITNGSKRTWTFRCKKELNDEISHVWNRITMREGIRYVLNEDYPLLEKIYDSLDQEITKLLKQYIKVIESNLPLNALHQDLVHDEKFIYDEEKVEKNRNIEIISTIFDRCTTEAEINEMTNQLMSTEPFLYYEDVIMKLAEEARKNVG